MVVKWKQEQASQMIQITSHNIFIILADIFGSNETIFKLRTLSATLKELKISHDIDLNYFLLSPKGLQLKFLDSYAK